MSEQDRESGERLERLLRQWGAEEASRGEATAGGFPRRRPGESLASAGRWLALAAGLAICAAGAAMLVLAGRWGAGGRDGGADPRVTAIQTDLQQALGELETTRTTLAEVQRLAREQQGKFSAEIARLGDGFETERAKILAEADRRAEALRGIVDRQQTTLQGLQDRLDEREKAVAGLRKDLDSRVAASQELQAAHGRLTAEVERLRSAAETARNAQHQTQEQLASVEDRQAAMTALFQRVYLAAAAPGEAGLRARQVAAQQSHLIRRGAELRPALTDEGLRQLFDTQEVLLTRLALLDPDNRAERESFVRLLRALDVTRRIDEAVRTPALDPDVRGWLIENRMLLAEVDRAG